MQIQELFIRGLERGYMSPEDFEEYLKRYVNLVKASPSLPENDKNRLMVFFSVAGYSYNYWSSLWTIEEEEVDPGIMP